MKKILFFDIAWRFAQGASKQLYHLGVMSLGVYYLGLDEFGRYAYLTSIVIICSLVADFGVSSSVAKYFSSESPVFNVLNEVLSFVFVLILAVFIVVSVYLYFINELGFSFFNIILVGLCVIFSVFSSILDGVNRGLMYFDVNSKANIFSSILSFSLVYPSIYFFGLTGLVFNLMIFYFINFIYLYIKINMLWRYKINFSCSEQTKLILKYSFIIGVSSLGLILYTKADQIILGNYGYTKELGVFEMMERLLLFVLVPFGMVAQVLAPRIIKTLSSSPVSGVKMIYKITSYLIALQVICYITLIILMSYYDEIILFSGRVELQQFKPIILILFFVFPIRAFSIFQTQAFIIPTGHANIIMFTTILFGMLNVVLDIIFINMYGFIGVFYSTLVVIPINTIVQTVIYHFRLKKIGGVNFNERKN